MLVKRKGTEKTSSTATPASRVLRRNSRPNTRPRHCFTVKITPRGRRCGRVGSAGRGPRKFPSAGRPGLMRGVHRLACGPALGQTSPAASVKLFARQVTRPQLGGGGNPELPSRKRAASPRWGRRLHQRGGRGPEPARGSRGGARPGRRHPAGSRRHAPGPRAHLDPPLAHRRIPASGHRGPRSHLRPRRQRALPVHLRAGRLRPRRPGG